MATDISRLRARVTSAGRVAAPRCDPVAPFDRPAAPGHGPPPRRPL